MSLISTPDLRSGLIGLGLNFIRSHVSLKHLIITATATVALAEERGAEEEEAGESLFKG